MSMGMVTRAAERETRGPMMDSGIYQPPIRGFMDDLTVTTTTHIQARWVLSALEDSVSWARQRNPDVSYWERDAWTGESRCRSKERRSSIVENIIKCLGKWFNESLTDKESIEDTKKKLLSSWLRTVDDSGLPGKYNAWDPIKTNVVAPHVWNCN